MIRTRISFAAVALALCFGSSAAHAQFTAYADVTVQQLSGIQSSPLLSTLSPAPCAGSTTLNCTAYNNSVHPIGFTGGGGYDFKSIGRITLSADLRAIILSDKRGAETYADGAGIRIYSGLGGVRAAYDMKVNGIRFRPYLEGAFGYGRSNYGVLTNAMLSTNGQTPGIPTQNNLEFHIYAGTDLRILPSVDWRVFEAGYGALEPFGTYAHSYPLYSISSGIVFHIPPRVN